MIRIEEIANKDFKSVIWGYDPQSVDSYLDEIIALIAQMQRERDEMMSTIDYLVSVLEDKSTPQTDLQDNVVDIVSPHDGAR